MYHIEVRNTAGKLLAILENAYEISYTQEVNTPQVLNFSLPAWDPKVSYLIAGNEYWLIKDGVSVVGAFQMDAFQNNAFQVDVTGNETVHKFKLQTQRDIRQ